MCKHDLVLLPRALRRHFGNSLPPLVLCLRVTAALNIADVFAGRVVHVNAQNYFKEPFQAVANVSRAIEYLIMDIEQVDPSDGRLAEVSAVRADRVGIEEPEYSRTHLGRILKPGGESTSSLAPLAL